VVDGPVVVDSRRSVPGALFVCLVGDNGDGHDHVADAMARGAAAALAARPVGGPAVVVEDPLRALGALAAGMLRKAGGCDVVGVTGSSGKTTTKDLLAQVFEPAGPTVAPTESFNNEIGLPLTVLSIDASTQTLVCEYSARGPGHIRYLCEIAPPRIGIVLNVGAAHLGEFGSREAIAQAKGELVEALPADGFAVLCADDPLVRGMSARTGARVVTFGAAPEADFRYSDVALDEAARPSFRIHTPDGEREVRLQVSGAHQAGNATAVTAAALAAGLDLDLVVDALGTAGRRSAHRMDVRQRADGLLVIDDAYNANPESMRAGLDALAAIGRDRRRWAVLGEMRELGPDAESLHAEVGRHAAVTAVDELVAVGPAAPIAEGARHEADWGGRARTVADVAAASELLRAEVTSTDAVLVKASNSLHFWDIADALIAQVTTGAAS
jgi:UDP-N-acetylmuramoyl-tripeptide--D-alanyl-D-alanine ligase